MFTKSGVISQCYKCLKPFDIYEMFVNKGQNICIPCYQSLGLYYEVPFDESNYKKDWIYKHIPRDILDPIYARLDPDKWT